MNKPKTIYRLSSLLKKLRTQVQTANETFAEIEETVTFQGFEGNPPPLWTSDDGEIMLTYGGHDIPLSSLMLCIETRGAITRYYVERVIICELSL